MHLEEVIDSSAQRRFLLPFKNDKNEGGKGHEFPGEQETKSIAHSSNHHHSGIQPQEAEEVKGNNHRSLFVDVRFEISTGIQSSAQANEIDN